MMVPVGGSSGQSGKNKVPCRYSMYDPNSRNWNHQPPFLRLLSRFCNAILDFTLIRLPSVRGRQCNPTFKVRDLNKPVATKQGEP